MSICNRLSQFSWGLCWSIAATDGDVRSAFFAVDATSSSTRAIIEDMKIVIKSTVQNFVTTRADPTANNVL